jgi:hypothetical protein
VSLSLVRLNDHTLIAIEWYQQGNVGPNWLYWISSDGSNWKPVSFVPLANFSFPMALPAHEGGLFYSTMDCPPAGYCHLVLSMYALSADDHIVTLDQAGDIPPVNPGPGVELAIGPAGVLASDGGSNMWLGART